MAVRKDHAKCTPKKFKYSKTWLLNKKGIILSSGPVLLVLLIPLLVPRSFIYVGRRSHEFMPSVFASLDTFTAGSDAPLEIPLPAQSGLERDMKSTANLDSVSFDSIPPTGCLAMIIKNEGPILPRLFESVRGFVSEYCVVDTGSTDDTIDVLKSMDMPGVVLEEPFVDFATTRNYMIDKCRQVMTSCDYLVLLDADMVLRVSPAWDWAKLDGRDVFNLVQISGVEYENVRMIRRDAPDIRVVGATHEYYDVPTQYTRGTLPKELIHIEDVGDGKAKGDKFERDERLLRRELEKDPDNVRTVFYLANTLKDQGKYADAIPYYERRATMGGWFAEADYSRFMLSTCYLALNDLDNARKYGELAAFAGMAKRAEPLYFLAFHLRQHGQDKLAYYYATLAAKIPKPGITRALFISNAIYDYWVDYERAILYRHVFPSQHMEGMRIALTFWNNAYAPQDLRESFASLMKAYVRPIAASASDEKYRFRTAGTETPLAIFSSKNRVHVLLPEAKEGSVELAVLDVDIRANSTGDQGIVPLRLEILPSDHAMSNIVWLFKGPNCVIGFSASGSHVYQGEWSTESDAHVHLQSLVTDWQATQQAPLSNSVGNSGVVYCISRWYPTIEVGWCKISLSSAVCETYTSQSQVPRAFSFFSATANGVAYRGDIWFLLRVGALNAFVMVVLRPDFTLKAFTPPFSMETDKKAELGGMEVEEGPFSFDIVTANDGQDHMVHAYTSGNDVVISRIKMEEVHAWMV
jgi:glycosyltransferase involved in cell wall biosynthesis